MSCLAYCQIGIGVNPPHPSAILQVQDTTKGLLIPRMTAAQRINIQDPAEGLMVYQTDSPAGFWYYRNEQWINTFPSNGGGKNTLILADSITNAEAQLKIANEVGPNTEEIRILRCSNLTTVDLSMLTKSVVLIDIEDNTVLQNVNLGNLKTIETDIYINNCPQLTTLTMSSLTSIGRAYTGANGLSMLKTGIQNINFPVLKQVTGWLDIEKNPALTNLDMPQLLSQGSVLLMENPLLASVSFQSVKKLNYFFVDTAPSLTAVDFQSLATIGSFTLPANQLQSISFPALQVITSVLTITAPQLSTLFAASLVSGKIQLTGGSLNAVNFNSLQTTTSINISATSGLLSSINFQSLQTALSGSTNAITISGIGTLSFPQLHKTDAFSVSQVSSLSLPVLDTVSYTLDIHNSTSLASLTFPALKKTNGIVISNCGITSLSFPSLIANNNPQFTGVLGITFNPNLTSISWPNFQAINNNYASLNNNKLPSSQVNAILALFRATLTVFGSGSLYLRQTPAAPPTGQGITDKNYLISQGIFVDSD
ncbi:MAG: hypothetical protein ABI741_11435 [Ferruginibacter sp.]